MTTSYCIRIDVIGDELFLRERLVAWLAKKGTAIGCYETHNDNRHYHLWLKSDVRIASLRANFKYHFTDHKGNASYSIKEAEGNLQYIAKGDSVQSAPVIIVNTMGFTDDELKQAHDERWRVTAELQRSGGNVRKSFLETVLYRWTHSSLYERWKNEYEDRTVFDAIEVDRMAMQLSVWMIGEFKSMRRLLDLPIVRKYVNLCLLEIVSAQSLNDAWHRGESRFF